MATVGRSDSLQGAEFVDADLRGARFVRADLSGVVMREVDVNGPGDPGNRSAIPSGGSSGPPAARTTAWTCRSS